MTAFVVVDAVVDVAVVVANDILESRLFIGWPGIESPLCTGLSTDEESVFTMFVVVVVIIAVVVTAVVVTAVVVTAVVIFDAVVFVSVVFGVVVVVVSAAAAATVVGVASGLGLKLSLSESSLSKMSTDFEIVVVTRSIFPTLSSLPSNFGLTIVVLLGSAAVAVVEIISL